MTHQSLRDQPLTQVIFSSVNIYSPVYRSNYLRAKTAFDRGCDRRVVRRGIAAWMTVALRHCAPPGHGRLSRRAAAACLLA
jgi:hypothetical protein